MTMPAYKCGCLAAIISGGQTGADQGGLHAGRQLGLATGGTAPPGWITELGPQEELLRSFGLVEGEQDPTTYQKRTFENVRSSSLTVIFGDHTSPGSKLTIKFCRELGKPAAINPPAQGLVTVIRERKIVVLNVAGNRESKNPGIQQYVFIRLLRIGRWLRYLHDQETNHG